MYIYYPLYSSDSHIIVEVYVVVMWDLINVAIDDMAPVVVADHEFSGTTEYRLLIDNRLLLHFMVQQERIFLYLVSDYCQVVMRRLALMVMVS